MKFIREHKKISIIILLFLVIFLGFGVTFSRYIKNIISNYILETRGFYFNSSVLSMNHKNYLINNWDGVNTYNLTIDLSNRKNDERVTNSDITYRVEVNCSNTVICTLSKDSGIIHPEDTSDTYQISVTPVSTFHEGDTVTVSTIVTSNLPYKKVLSATYTIGVEDSDFSYNIVDSVNSKYLEINFINSISYYQVSEAFGSYSEGDHVSLEEYSRLSSSEKDKCYSAIVNVKWDPRVLFVDMTNNLYLNRLSTNYAEEVIDGHSYVKRFSFKVNASSSNTIKFYKDDPTQNYTYPIVNERSIITVSVMNAN